MQRCLHCAQPLFYWQIWKNLMWNWGYKPTRCDTCGKTYRLASSSRYAASFALSVPILPSLLVSLFVGKQPMLVAGGCYLALASIVSLLLPFVVRYELSEG